MRTSPDDVRAERLRNDIANRLRHHPFVLMPVHTRSHWATCIIEKRKYGGMVATIYDSAPGPITRKDFETAFQRLRIPLRDVICHARQPRFSNDCGLHLVLLAIWKKRGLRKLPIRQADVPDVISLESWRTILHKALKNGINRAIADELLCAVPQAAALVGFKIEPSHMLQAAAEKPTRPQASSTAPRMGPQSSHEADMTQGGTTPVRKGVPQPEAMLRRGPDGAPTIVPIRARPASASTAEKQNPIPRDTPTVTLELMGGATNKSPASTAQANDALEKVRKQAPACTWAIPLRPDSLAPPKPGNKVIIDADAEAAELFINGKPEQSDFRDCPLSLAEVMTAGKWSKAQIKQIYGWFDERAQQLKALSRSDARVEVQVRLAPRSLANSEEFIKVLNHVAEKKARANNDESLATELRDRILSAYQAGILLSDTLVDIVVQQMAKHLPHWTCLRTTDFDWYTRQGRPGTMPEQLADNVAVVAFLSKSSHFVLFTFSGGRFEIRDSLAPNPGAKGWQPSRETLDVAGRFIDLLLKRGKSVKHEGHWMTCEKQGTNNCGIESINNLALRATGVRGVFSRQNIGLARQQCNAAKKLDEFKFTVFDTAKVPAPAKVEVPVRQREPSTATTKQPSPAPTVAPAKKITATATTTGPTPKAASVTTSDQHKHRGGDTEAPPADAKPVVKRCCMCEGYCAWHHPKIEAIKHRGCCAEKKTSSGRHCRESAMGIAGATHCWHHARDRERQNVIAAITGKPIADDQQEKRQAPTYSHNPYGLSVLSQHLPSSRTVQEPNKALTHSLVSDVLKGLPRGTAVEIDLKRETERRCKIRLSLNHAPRDGYIGKATIVARYCEECEQWHRVDNPPLPLPESDTKYFRVSVDPLPALDSEDITDECDWDGFGSDTDYIEDYDEPATEEELAQMKELLRSYEPERQYAGTKPVGPTGSLRGNFLRGTFIHHRRPMHIHAIAWNEKAESTRAKQARWLDKIRNLPEDYDKDSLAHAILDMVLRSAQEAKTGPWSWSTISTVLSTIQSAFLDLHLYTNRALSIQLQNDRSWHAATKLAGRLAKTRGTKPKNSEPLTWEEHLKVADDLRQHVEPWTLNKTGWYLQARVDEVRRLLPKNINLDKDSDEHDNVRIWALFTEGRGPRFCGPYVIHSTMPASDAKVLREYLRTRPQDTHAWTTANQRMVSKAVAQFPGHTLKSIRKGALTHLSGCGVKIDDLMKASGHKQKKTLLRYLGWGEKDGEAISSAKERARLVAEAQQNRSNPTGGAMNDHPMKMGVYSGFNGSRGKRMDKPPAMLMHQAPSRKDLGLMGMSREDTSKWPLHTKPLPKEKFDFFGLEQEVVEEDLFKNVVKARRWLTEAELYGSSHAPFVEAQIPYSSFTSDHILQMLKEDKMRPLRKDQQIMSFVKGFPAPQHAKRTLRPVFEPIYNKSILRDHLPELKYRSRAERRSILSGRKYIFLFDFKAWFDQFELGDGTHAYHVLRVKEPVEWDGEKHTLFFLTRDPMGASHAPHTCNTATWALCEPILKMKLVDIVTMIDNVCIASDNEDEFVKAVQTFVERCDKFRAVLNDRDDIPTDRDGILRIGRQTATSWTPILGEEFNNGLVRNTEKCMANLEEAYDRLQQSMSDSSAVVTRRNVAALISLAFYMAGTLEIRIAENFELMRLHSKISAMRGSWDTPYRITMNEMNHLSRLVGRLSANEPIRPTLKPLPAADLCDYDAVMIIDACGSGFGAWVLMEGTTYELRAGWHTYIRHSAWAEPMAGKEVAAWVRARCKGRLAVVTDHYAMVSGQRRPVSSNGGFSLAYHLNEFFREIYGRGSGSLEADVFYVEGPKNPVDGISRMNLNGQPLSVRVIDDVTFPPLSSFYHPYRELPERAWWNV